jgi:XTP/dITP diphosphohydrolase
MTIVLGTSNRGKLKEFKEMYKTNIISFQEILGKIEIDEIEDSFQGNSILKAKTIYNMLPNKEKYIVIADDSGLVVPILNGEPGIYSARYAGENASDRDNIDKLLSKLKDKNIKCCEANYICAISIVSKYGIYCVHGWIYGEIVNTLKGDNGFGYDPLFTPFGYNQTMAEIDGDIKSKISHRAKALELAKPIIEMCNRY